MTFWATIQVISQVLALCGVISIRKFSPIFLYLFSVRLALDHPNWKPEQLGFIRQLAGNIPEEFLSTEVLTVIGILAAIELVAMWCPDIKEYLVENEIFDRYFKVAISIIVSVGLMTAAQESAVKELLNGATQIQTASLGNSILISVVVVTGGYVTWTCCQIRAAVLGLIQTIDPENDLGLQSLSNCLGEIAVIVIVLLLLFLATFWVAFVLTLIVMLAGYCFQHLLERHERKHSHLCAACTTAGKETLVSDCALICPECGTEQPNVRQVGWFGFSGTSPLADMTSEQHAFRLLAAHRCRWCASPLNRTHGCPRCGREQWTAELRTYYLRQTDIQSRRSVLWAIPFPFFARILLRQLAIRPLNVHLRTGERFLTGVAMMTIKLILLPILLILYFLSIIPLIGFPIYLLSAWRYNSVRAKFYARLSTVPGRSQGNN